MFKHFFLVTAIMFSPVCHSDSPTVKDYQNNEANGTYDLYLYGLESGLEWAQEYTFAKNSIEFFCKPNDLILSAAKLRSLVNKEIEDNISFYTKYNDAPLIGLALRNAYISNFPCN